jgi:hypothetical protein
MKRRGGDMRRTDGLRWRIGYRQGSERGQRTVVPRVHRGRVRSVILLPRMLAVVVRMVGEHGVRCGRHRNTVDRANFGNGDAAQVRSANREQGHRCPQEQATDGSPQRESRQPAAVQRRIHLSRTEPNHPVDRGVVFDKRTNGMVAFIALRLRNPKYPTRRGEAPYQLEFGNAERNSAM